ncbi:MAG TPA: hypothetical protein VG077_17480 [Verrucomicrobiae bacterium]|nr:hypothetical protein [Verrucomicrobiae bacterium]
MEVIGKTSAPRWLRSLFNGLAQIIVQSTRDLGEFRLTASSEGLKPATATIQTQPLRRVRLCRDLRELITDESAGSTAG